MKRPLVGIALIFCAGIALADLWQPSLAMLAVVFAATLLAAVAALRRASGTPAVYSLVLLGGLLAHALATTFPEPNHLPRLIGDRAQSVALRAVVTEEPVRKFYRRPRGEQEREYFSARVEALDRSAGWENASGFVAVWLDSPPADEQLRYGDRIEFRAVVRPVPVTVNPGQFDYRTYLARRGIFYEARIHDASECKLLNHKGRWLMDCGMWVQRRFLVSAARGLEITHTEDEQKIVGLLRAILVGFRPGLTNELAEPFMRTGTLHVFAVSGLHVAVIAGILVGLLRFCRVPRRACAIVALPLLLFYTIATGAPASAVRSFIMAAIIIIGWSLPRPADMLNSIAAAAIAVLLLWPLQLFDIGFQLSFVVVIFIALLAPGPGFLVRTLYRRSQPEPDSLTTVSRWHGRYPDVFVCDPYLPRELLPRWRRAWYSLIHAVTASLAVSVAACLGSIPLIAHYFHLFTPINFLSNLFIVPLSSLTIIVGFASFLADFVWPWLAGLLNNANYLFMEIMLQANHVFEVIPAAFVYVKSAPVWLAGVYYIAAAALLCKSLWQHASRVGWSCAVAISALAVGLAARNSDQTVTITALNVGNGSAIFLDFPGERHDTLVDCGRLSDAQFTLKPFLRSQGCDGIETLVLTHADASHVGGVGVVRDGFQPRRIYDNGNSRWTRITGSELPAYQAIRLAAYSSVPLTDGAELRILHPPVGPLPRVADDAALVMQLRCGLHRVLMTSDTGATVERRLLAQQTDLRSDVLIKGLHSREDSCTDEFLDAVAPQWVIICCGGFAEYDAPSPAMIERIRRHGAQVVRTDQHGGVTVRMQPDELSVKSFLPATATVLSSAPRDFQ